MILPEPVRGISGDQLNDVRHLVGRQMSPAMGQQRPRFRRVLPGRGTTNSAGTSPRCSCGTPTTAQSSTAANVFTTSSISAGAMFWPPRMISSLSRPVMVRKPFASRLAEIAGVIPAVAQRASRFFRLVVIAGHDVGAVNDQFAFLARRDVFGR